MSASRSIRYITAASFVLLLSYGGAAIAQVPLPPGSEEIRYSGYPLYSDYPLHLYRGDAVFVDLDGTDFMDLVMTGLQAPLEFGGPRSNGYGGIFSHRSLRQQVEPGQFIWVRFYERRVVPGFTNMYNGTLAVADHNNDGRPDIAASGRMVDDEFTPVSMIVEQVDSLRFAIRNPTAWPGVVNGSMAWGDFDNDGRADMLITGRSGEGFVTRLSRNLGRGAYQLVEAGLPDIGFGDAVWGDSDNDGDLDILLSGALADGRFISRLYLNEDGHFAEADVDLPGLAFGHARWMDLNADGRLDIILSGARQSPFILEGGLYVFHNTGGNTFERAPMDVPAHFDGDFDLIDWDTDGDIDILASGFVRALGQRTAQLYTNEHGTLGAKHLFLFAPDMTFATGDYDRDNDVDIFVTGYTREEVTLIPPVASFYAAIGGARNAPPTAPTALSTSATANRVDLSWSPSTDDITPDLSLTYNIRVGTRPGGVNVVSPLAHPISGKRYVCEQGNVFHNTSWHLDGLPPGTYYWSVQAVDQSCVGSTFASEGTFTVQGTTTSGKDERVTSQVMLESGFPNPFHDRTSIRYSLPGPIHARLVVYDVLGRSVRTLVDGVKPAGMQTAVWDGRDDRGVDLPPGLYLYRLESPSGVRSGSLMLVR